MQVSKMTNADLLVLITSPTVSDVRYAEAYAELLRRLDTGERWVRVSERLPDNQGWYYIYPTPKEWSKPIWHGAWFANGRWWESGMPTARLYGGESSITHWMIPPSDPLPAPSSEAVQGQKGKLIE